MIFLVILYGDSHAVGLRYDAHAQRHYCRNLRNIKGRRLELTAPSLCGADQHTHTQNNKKRQVMGQSLHVIHIGEQIISHLKSRHI
jgi:hypothetical protein